MSNDEQTIKDFFTSTKEAELSGEAFALTDEFKSARERVSRERVQELYNEVNSAVQS